MQKDAGKGEALLLAPGERLIPWRLLLKTIDEVLEPHALERLGNLLDALAVRGLRIGRGTAQCSDRNVGPLRHEEHLRAAGDLYIAFAPWPQAGNRAHQRALPRARFSRHKDALTRHDIHLGVLDDRLTSVERDREIGETQRRSGALSTLDPVDTLAFLCAFERIERPHSEATRRADAVQSARRG